MEYTCKCISNDAELGGRSRVGIFKENDNYSIITPYGLLLPDIIDATDRDRILILKKYAKCITKALSKQKVRQMLYANIGTKNNPLAALNVVLDYVQNGPYREFENETVIREFGKIDFKKTISKVKPSIVDNEALYTSFVVSRKKVSSQELVTIAQGNVINHFMENGGEILFGNLVRVTVPKIALDNNLITKLKSVKATSFNSRKQQLIQWIIDYIQGAITKKDVGTWQYSIVASTLWEEMIDFCYSNQINRNKTLYGRKFEMKEETAESGKHIVHTSSPTQHDTIYETLTEIAIIDAKMYKTAASLNNSEVMEKQFGYYIVAKVKNPNKRVYSILIKPYIEGVDAKEGFIAKTPFINAHILPYDDSVIFVYSIKFETVLNAYYTGKKLSNELIESAREYFNS